MWMKGACASVLWIDCKQKIIWFSFYISMWICIILRSYSTLNSVPFTELVEPNIDVLWTHWIITIKLVLKCMQLKSNKSTTWISSLLSVQFSLLVGMDGAISIQKKWNFLRTNNAHCIDIRFSLIWWYYITEKRA